MPRLPILGFALIAAIAPAHADSVEVTSQAYVTKCAEEDNVFLTFAAPKLRALAIEALHPPYIGAVEKDSYDPDFTNCNFGPAPTPTGRKFEAKKFILWENSEYIMEGNTDQYFWRDTDVPVIVGSKSWLHVHLIQFYKKRAFGKPDQVLVLYPTDGHWRTKPLPVPRLDYNVYGVSFLLGPVVATVPHKPYVSYKDVRFDPDTLSFRMSFEAGGAGSVRITEISQRSTSVEVTFDAAMPEGAPFAAMRSMFVSPRQADVGEVRIRDASGTEKTVPIESFTKADAASIVFSRPVVSDHNRSAPDMVYQGFRFAQ